MVFIESKWFLILNFVCVTMNVHILDALQQVLCVLPLTHVIVVTILVCVTILCGGV